MLNLIPYESDLKKYFKEISNSKRGSITISEKGEKVDIKVKDILNSKNEEIIERFEEYFVNKNKLENLNKKEYRDFEKEALLSCYNNSTKKLKELKRKILNLQNDVQRDICQYCGINSFDTFDHYLPKSHFPEYSVLSINLVPCCNKCNQNKSSDWKDNRGKRNFINLYYDELPDKPCINFKVTYDNDIPVFDFTLSKPDNYDENENLIDFNLFESHFNKLSLIKRFERKINGYITEIRKVLRSHKKFTFKDIKKYLEEEYEAQIDIYGVNYWKSALLKGLMESEEFIKDCIEN